MKTWCATCASAPPRWWNGRAPVSDGARRSGRRPGAIRGGGAADRRPGRSRARRHQCAGRAGYAAGAAAQHGTRAGARRTAVGGSAARSGAADARSQAQHSPPNGSSRCAKSGGGSGIPRRRCGGARRDRRRCRRWASRDDGAGPDDGSLFYVRSPIAGRVLERHAVLGQYAEPARRCSHCRLEPVWVMAQAFERDAVNVRVGSTRTSPSPRCPGRSSTAASRWSAARSTRVAHAFPSASSSRIRRASCVRACPRAPGSKSRGQSRTILAVPAAALQRVGDRWLAFVPRRSTSTRCGRSAAAATSATTSRWCRG